MHRITAIILSILAITAVSASAQKRATKKAVDYAEAAAVAKGHAKTSLHHLDLDAASDYADKWEEAMEKQKKPVPAELDSLRERILMARNMLERVEKLQIVDTLHVDAESFYKYYRLSTSAGTLSDAELLPDTYNGDGTNMVYMPENGKEMLWGQPDEEGHRRLAISKVLDNGEVEAPAVYGTDFIDGSVDYPFMMQDGTTIYFAATGDQSLGGYDIFMTRRDEDGEMLQPQNMGMPYNSPYNDYMLAIDEATGLGWWASDREGIPGVVTIYVFVPSQMRTNYEPDREDIQECALLLHPEVEGGYEERLPQERADSPEEFYLPLGNGQVYTRLTDFKNSQARQAMRNLLKRIDERDYMQQELESLRERYAQGDKTVASEILRLEKADRDAQTTIKRNTNQVISTETRR